MNQNTLLIADDNTLSRSVLKRLFEKEYHILQAGDGREALALFTAHQPELAAVLLDLHMPEYDGMYFLRQREQTDPDHQVPVICITGDERESSLIQAYHLGASNYVLKPFSTDHVYSVVQGALGPKSGHSQTDHLTMLTRLMNLLNRGCGAPPAFHMALEMIGAYLGADRVSLYLRPLPSEDCQWRREGASDSYQTTYRWLTDHSWCSRWSPPEEWMLWVGPDYGSHKEYGAYYRTYGIRAMLCLKIEGIRAEPAYLMIENARRVGQDVSFCAALQSCFSLAVKNVELGIVDQTTGVYNRRLYSDYTRRLTGENAASLGLIVMNLNSMHQYISIYGQDAGDELLERTAGIIDCHTRGLCFRTGGDEFTAVLRDAAEEETIATMERISQACRSQNIGLSLGCAWSGENIDPEALFREADGKMRESKQRHYSTLNVTNR